MNTTTETKLTPEDYTQAMNSIGQNLLQTLAQTVEKLPAPMRSANMVMQGIAAFLGNVLHRQLPQDEKARNELHAYLTQLVGKHLAAIKS